MKTATMKISRPHLAVDGNSLAAILLNHQEWAGIVD